MSDEPIVEECKRKVDCQASTALRVFIFLRDNPGQYFWVTRISRELRLNYYATNAAVKFLSEINQLDTIQIEKRRIVRLRTQGEPKEGLK